MARNEAIHPAKEAKRYQVRDAHDYLVLSGAKP